MPRSLNALAARLEALAASLQPAGVVRGFGWVSLPFATPLEQVARVQVSNVGHSSFDQQRVWACSPNLFDISFGGLVRPAAYHQPFALLDFLYSANASGSALMGSRYGQLLGVREGADFLLEVTLREPGTLSEAANEQTRLHRMRVGALMHAGPRFLWSRYPLVFEQDLVLSLPALLRLLGRYDARFRSLDQVPLGEFMLQLAARPPKREVDALKRELDRVISGREGISVWDLGTALEPTEVSLPCVHTGAAAFLLAAAVPDVDPRHHTRAHTRANAQPTTYDYRSQHTHAD